MKKKLFLLVGLAPLAVFGQVNSLSIDANGILSTTNLGRGILIQGQSLLTNSDSFVAQWLTNINFNAVNARYRGDNLAALTSTNSAVITAPLVSISGTQFLYMTTPNVISSTAVTNQSLVLYNASNGTADWGNANAYGATIGQVGSAITALKLRQATFSAGTVTVSDTSIKTNSIILPSYATFGGVLTGLPFVSSITAGTSFVVKSTLGTDTNVINILIINQ